MTRRPVKEPPFSEQFIEHALKIGVIELKEQKLKSGRISPYFFNSGKFDSGRSLNKLTAAYARVICEHFQKDRNFTFDVLYGPPYKGTMIVPALAGKLETVHDPIRYCSSRKEVKQHGEEGLLLAAPIRPGDRVLIVDDVITDGWTKKEAVKFIKEQGGEPVGLIIAFDRRERGEDSDFSAAQEFERGCHIPVVAVATLNDLIKVLERQRDEEKKEVLEKIRAYQRMYGV